MVNNLYTQQQLIVNQVAKKARSGVQGVQGLKSGGKSFQVGKMLRFVKFCRQNK